MKNQTETNLEIINNVPMMGSKEIAKLTKKTVGNVNADIWSMLD